MFQLSEARFGLITCLRSSENTCFSWAQRSLRRRARSNPLGFVQFCGQQARPAFHDVYKVKAHCGEHDLCQDPFLTEGNSCADKLAKDTAWAFLETCQQTACEELALAMSLQAHLVHTLATRSLLFKMLPAEIPAGQDFFSQYKVLTSSFVCSCAPKLGFFQRALFVLGHVAHL